MVKSMASNFSEHTSANYFLHTGNGFQGRPSMGAWLGYGLGTENRNLPGFVVLNGGLIPPADWIVSGPVFCLRLIRVRFSCPHPGRFANITRRVFRRIAEVKVVAPSQYGRGCLSELNGDPQVEAAIRNYETAFLMQAVPELMDLKGESEAVKKSYGMDSSFKNTRTFGLQCLTARRLVERGVRFIELTCPGGNGDGWDQHNKLQDGHTKNCKSVDQSPP